MWFLLLGSSCSEEALEPVSNPVWQQHWKPLRCLALSLLHSVLHHRGARLLQHRQPHGTHEWEGLPRRRRLHLKIRQSLRLMANTICTVPPVKTAACLELHGKKDNSPPTAETREEVHRLSPVSSQFPPPRHSNTDSVLWVSSIQRLLRCFRLQSATEVLQLD